MEALLEKGFPAAARFIVVFDASDNPAYLGVDAFQDGLHLIIDAGHLRVFGLERLQTPHVLAIELDVGLFQLLDQRIFQDGRKGIVVSIPGLSIEGLLGNPIRFGLG